MHAQQSKLFHAFRLQCYGAHIRTFLLWKRGNSMLSLFEYEVENLIESHRSVLQ